MPWTVKKNGDKYCLYKKGDGSLVAGSCHTNRADTIKQMRAMYANEGKSFSEKCIYVPTKGFSELETVDERKKWIQIFPFGHWTHPVFTDTTVTRETAEQYVKNFHDNVRRQKISTDYDHGQDKAKGNKASGEYLDMEVREDGVYALLEFTETAFSEIAAGEWKYFSPLFYDVWDDHETEETFENVVVGGALTNNPWMKDMVPINFSEAVLEEQTTKYRFKDSKWIASDNNGESWRVATTDEVAELEHSEPGTGNPPEPRTDEDDRSGDKDGEGIRRDSPPPQDEKEGSDVNLTKETLILLGLPEDADEATVNTTVTELYQTVEPLKKFHEEHKAAKKFSEDYPEQAKEMERLRKAEEDRMAKSFSERYERIVTVKGEGDEVERVSTNKGFSGLVINAIEEMAKAFSEGNGNITEVQKVLDLVATDKAIVDYGEVGSNRVREEENFDDNNVAKSFAEKAVKIQEASIAEGKPLSWGDAIAKAATENPEMAKAYSERRLPNA